MDSFEIQPKILSELTERFSNRRSSDEIQAK